MVHGVIPRVWQAIVESTLTGFGMVARVAARFHNVEVFDRVIIALCRRSLLGEKADPAAGADEVRAPGVLEGHGRA